jgi:hypothetical protein
MTAEGVWVEFYGGPLDGEMAQVADDEDGAPLPIAKSRGTYWPAEEIGDGLIVRMRWLHRSPGLGESKLDLRRPS